jgi:Heparinase II/III-like protein/Heparinase II/III N-terminus
MDSSTVGMAQAPPLGLSMFSRIVGRKWLGLGAARPTERDVLQLTREDFDVFRNGYAEQARAGFRPRRDLPSIRLEQPVDWSMDPFQDRNWSFQLQAWRMLDPIWQEWYGVDWNRLKAEIMPWVEDWHAFHVVRKKNSPFSWYDMSTGLRAQHLALIVHLHRQGLMRLLDGELAFVRDLSELHVATLMSPGFVAMNNHGLFQLRGLRLLGIVWVGEEFVKAERSYSSLMMTRLLARQFDSYGMHVENSPDYHGLVYRKFAEIRPELFPGIKVKLERTMKRAKEILPWFTFPDLTIACIGDSAGRSEKLSIRAKPDYVIPQADGDIWVRDLSRSGYAIVRSSADVPVERASMLVVKAQALSETHAHADHLGLLLYHAGHHLFADSGKYTYNHGQWRDYFVSDRAHNVVGLAGTEFGPQHTTTSGPGLNHVLISDDTVMIEGEISRREFFHHERRILYRLGRSLHVRDQICARPGDAPIAYWHMAAGVDVERVAGGLEIFANGTKLARITVNDPAIKPRLVRGQVGPKIQGWLSPAYGVKVEAAVVELRAPPDCEVIETIVELYEPAALDPGKLPRRICHGIRFRFPFVFVSDRVHVMPDGRTRRKVTVDLPDAYPLAVSNSLSKALHEKEFRCDTKSRAKGVHSLEFSHEDRTRVSVNVRHAVDELPARLVLSWERAPQASSRIGSRVE